MQAGCSCLPRHFYHLIHKQHTACVVARRKISIYSVRSSIPHHERVGPLVLELGPLPKVVENPCLVNVVQRGHVGHDFRVVRVGFPEPLNSCADTTTRSTAVPGIAGERTKQ